MSTVKRTLNFLLGFTILFLDYSKIKAIQLNDEYSPTESSDWQSLVFTMQWPLTACLVWKDEGSTHTCTLPEHHKWTVHGIWPNSDEGPLGPFYCNETWVFNPDGVKPVRQELIQMWPNIHGHDTVDSLWKHEWEKHGTCAALDTHFSSELLYFKQGLQWADEYQITNLLARKNILPSLTTQYNATLISQVISDATGVLPTIGCESDRETGLTYLAEIRICFRRDLELMDCKHHSGVKRLPPLLSVGDCPTHKLIFYPSDVFKESIQWLKKKHSLKRKLDKQEKLKNKSFMFL